MGNYILYGNCNKKLISLVLYTIVSVLLTFVPIELYIIYKYGDNKYNTNKNKKHLKLKNNYLYNCFLEYLGYLLCFIPEIFRKKNLKKKKIIFQKK